MKMLISLIPWVAFTLLAGHTGAGAVGWAAALAGLLSVAIVAWGMRERAEDPQTIILGSNPPGAAPRVSVGGDQISVYWDTSGEGPGWTSADVTPVTDGRWHHIAVVFDHGAITFYKDGVPTADTLTVDSPQQAAGDLQLGAGFGATIGFIGQIYGVRVWSIARTAQQITQNRWAPLGPPTPGLTVAASFDPDKQEIVNQVGGGTDSVSNCTVATTDLPVPAWALSFGGTTGDGVLDEQCQRAQQHRRDVRVLDEDVYGRGRGKPDPGADPPGPRRAAAHIRGR